MNLWASWCPPCRAEMPDLQRLAETDAHRGVAVVGVNEGESPQKARAFADALRIRFPIWIDSSERYGLIYAALGLPTTVIVDRRGIVMRGFDGPLTLRADARGRRGCDAFRLKRFLFGAAVVAVAVAVEILSPGHALYHYGWYNVALAALVVVVLIWRAAICRASRRRSRANCRARGRAGHGERPAFAGVANGLFAPDNRTYVGAPGERVRVEGLGALGFPLASQDAAIAARSRSSARCAPPLQVGARARNAGSFILRATPRSVVYVEARDAAGDRLTITQPQGAVFLSPVLLMQHQQKIEGMDLPFDSFNVPAAHRIVRAIMFTPAQAALLARAATAPGEGRGTLRRRRRKRSPGAARHRTVRGWSSRQRRRPRSARDARELPASRRTGRTKSDRGHDWLAAHRRRNCGRRFFPKKRG